jgi:hypothetical protein
LSDEFPQEPHTVATDHGGPKFDDPADEATPNSQEGNSPVEDEQRREDDETAQERRIGPGHGRLQGIGNEQDESEIEKRELTNLAFAEQAKRTEEDRVYDARADNEFNHRRTECPHSSGPPGAVAQKAVITEQRQSADERSGTTNLYSAGTVIRGPGLSEAMTP